MFNSTVELNKTYILPNSTVGFISFTISMRNRLTNSTVGAIQNIAFNSTVEANTHFNTIFELTWHHNRHLSSLTKCRHHMGCTHLATSIPDIGLTSARFLELNTKEHDYNLNTYIAVISFIPEYGSQQLHTWYGQPYWVCPCTCKIRIILEKNFHKMHTWYGQPYWVCPCTCKIRIVLEKNFHKIQLLTFVLLVGTFGVMVK